MKISVLIGEDYKKRQTYYQSLSCTSIIKSLLYRNATSS
ncbi:hypothetical protein MSA_19460 [Streptococcus agalactiae ILRI005]|nr:hypothetical protein MSA_19460 [Streptococcus agalactiae ILRI005]